MRRQRRSPLTPIFDAEIRRGGLAVGNTPGSTPFSYNAPTALTIVELLGGDALVAVGDGEMYVLDISVPSSPSLLGVFADAALAGTSNKKVWPGEASILVWNPDTDGIVAISIADPVSTSSVIGTVTLAGAADVEVYGFNLFAVYPASDEVRLYDFGGTLVDSLTDATNLDGVASVVGPNVHFAGDYTHWAVAMPGRVTVLDSTGGTISVVDTIADGDLAGAYLIHAAYSELAVATSAGLAAVNYAGPGWDGLSVTDAVATDGPIVAMDTFTTRTFITVNASPAQLLVVDVNHSDPNITVEATISLSNAGPPAGVHAGLTVAIGTEGYGYIAMPASDAIEAQNIGAYQNPV